MFDAVHPEQASGAAAWAGPDTLLIANKSDLATPRGLELSPPAIPVSAMTGEGIDALLAALGERVAQAYQIEQPLLTRARHRQTLEEAVAALHRSRGAVLPELRAEDLRLALRNLGRITGAVDVEDLLDVIFRDFCIGK